MFTHYFIENPLEWEKRSYLQPEMFSIHFRKGKRGERESMKEMEKEKKDTKRGMIKKEIEKEER